MRAASCYLLKLPAQMHLFCAAPCCGQANLRYEGEVLTDKLIKLRATRQDLETELFSLKDKRIKLLEVIHHLEDEEMQLVSEVSNYLQGSCFESERLFKFVKVGAC